MTEKNVPWIFGKLFTPFINAQARVSILQQTTDDTLEALAVADSDPVAGRAYFVNEDNNDAIITSAPLNDLGPNAQGQEVWGNPSGLAVAMNKTNASTANIGVVIALSGNKNDTTCGHPYVQCFDQSSSTGPSLLHIQGWSAAGTPSLTGPLARSVALSAPAGSTCSDAYYSNTTTTCTETISAWVDYGSTNTTGVTVKPVVAGSTGERTDARGDQRQRRSMDWDDLAQTSRSEQDRLARRLHEGQRRSLWHEHVDIKDDLQRSTSVRGRDGIGPDLGCLALGGWRCVPGRELVRGMRAAEPGRLHAQPRGHHQRRREPPKQPTLRRSELSNQDRNEPGKRGRLRGQSQARPRPNTGRTWPRGAPGRSPSILRIPPARPQGRARMTA